MSNVVINGLTAVHAGSNGTLVTSDTCLVPPYCIPYPFTNIAKSADSAMTATSVTINGNPVCHAKSNFAVSTGDSAGACGGIISGTVHGMAEFITFSNNVFIEGIPAVRQTDKMVSNNKNTSPMPLQQPGAGKPPDISAEGPKDLEAKEPPFEISLDVSGLATHMLKSVISIEEEEEPPTTTTSTTSAATDDTKTQENNIAATNTTSNTASNSTTIANTAAVKNRLIQYYGTDDWSKLKKQAEIDLGINDKSKMISPKERKDNFLLLAKRHMQTGILDPASLATFNKETAEADKVAAEATAAAKLKAINVAKTTNTKVKDVKPIKPDYDFIEKPQVTYSRSVDANSPEYIKLKTYSETEYGSLQIKKIVDNKSTYASFTVNFGEVRTAGGAPTFISFPPGFPKLKFFPGGEKMDYLAVMHHEFGHTNANLKQSTGFGETLLEERKVVRLFDNPVRIINGNEPRYSYFRFASKSTINIINSSIVKDGKATIDPNDASKLIDRTAEQAKLWDKKK